MKATKTNIKRTKSNILEQNNNPTKETKRDAWLTFQKGAFLFYSSASFTPPPLQKVFLLRLLQK